MADGLTPAPPAPDSGADVGQAPGGRRRRVRVIVGMVALVIVVLIALPVISTLQPGYYERYPELRERMDNWRTSTHGRMSCVSCHVDPGLGGALSFVARSIPAFYSQLIVGPHEDNLLDAPQTHACQQCHTSYRQVSADGDLLIPHRAHVEILEVECVVCHHDLVHSENPEGFNRPSMRMCLDECHNGEIAGEECVKCHTRKHVPDDHLRDDWLQIHAERSDTEDCGSCHEWTPDYCEECHSQRPATHVGNWKKGHAERARTHSSGCLVCHGGAAFCEECH